MAGTERPNEKAARHIVSTSMGLRVSRYEDGTRNAQVDALIHGADGTAALEIVADHEAAFNAQWDALAKVGHRVEVPGLTQQWSAQLARGSKVRTVVRKLPALMLRLQTGLEQGDQHDHRDLSEEFTRLGIQRLDPSDASARTGYVHLYVEGWGGFASSESMSKYVERILSDAPDVPAKLAIHPAVDKHVFIWATIGTEYGIQFQLERREQPLPNEHPRLPPGVTHVWVAGSFTSQGVLAWFPSRGWWRPAWAWPEGGQQLVLGED